MDKKELMQELENLKSALQTAATAEAKSQIEAKMAELKSKLDEIETLKAQIVVLKDAADKNQAVIDEFVAMKNKKPINEKENTFEMAVKTAVEENHDAIMKFSRKETKTLSMEIKAVADVSTANVTGSSVWGAVYRNGIITNPNQIGHLRNILMSSAAGPGTDFYFMRENGAGEGAPAPTSEKKAADATNVGTGLKPSFDIDLIEASVKFETIAGIMPISRKAMNNIPGLMSFLQTRVPEKLLDVEDAQILYGTGTSPELSGILDTGNYQDSTSVATVLAEAITDDISTLEDTYKRIANGILLRPREYHSFFKNKAAGSGEYDLPMNVTFVNGVLYISGVPVFKSTAPTGYDYVVGAWSGAELKIQENMRLEFFDQDGTNVRTNQTTLRIEEVVALPIYGNNYFIKGSADFGS